MEIWMYVEHSLSRSCSELWKQKIRFDYLISNEISKSQQYTAESEKKEKEREREEVGLINI